MKIYITVVLLVIANFQWVFILSNFERISNLKTISYAQVDVNAGKEYKTNLENNGFVSIENIIINPWYNKTIITPENIKIPSINVAAPIFTAKNNYDELLDQWVVNLDVWREGKYIFWHSSAITKTNFQYIFTKITKLWKGDSVFIENSDWTISEYKYKNAFYKSPNKLEELKDSNEKMYLITCYPFWTSLTRYVVELNHNKTYDKK